MGQPSDETLARQAQAGNVDSFSLLVGRYQRTVVNLAYRMLGDLHEAEDVAQEVFIRAYQSLGRYDPARRFFPWLYRIAINRCLSTRARPRPESLADETSDALADSAPSPEQQAARNETQADVQRAIAALPEHERSLVALRYGADLSYDEIAATMQLPLGTVKTRLFRARQRLAGLLDEDIDEA
ncbi:MAG: sigma-70 family RNA polymerase sigma factor [Roseiflexaceae bacterium]|nr:sigma-70 family RNA polymerase sigma factor [Roseiflexaceae bacterium]